MVSIPPQTSHRLQPLNVSFYGPLSAAYNKGCASYLHSHPGQKISAYEVAELFGEAYKKTANVEKVVSGFKACGIFPFDPEKNWEDEYKASASIKKP